MKTPEPPNAEFIKAVTDSKIRSLEDLGSFVIKAMITVSGVLLIAFLAMVHLFTGDNGGDKYLKGIFFTGVSLLFAGVIHSTYLAASYHVALMKNFASGIKEDKGSVKVGFLERRMFGDNVPTGSKPIIKSFIFFSIFTTLSMVLVIIALLFL